MASQTYSWQDFYRKPVPNDTGIVTPASYNVLSVDPQPPYTLTAGPNEATAPVSYNPSGMLYGLGQENQFLLASSTGTCQSGCVDQVHKPDPRVHQVKPLYQPHVFTAKPGSALPTAYNTTGMY